jgi:Uma2 family endonuclease
MARQGERLIFGPADAGRRVSGEEFAEAGFREPWRYERSEGILQVVSPEGQRHHDHSRPWRQAFGRFWADRPDLVEELVVQAWIRVDEATDRLADIGVYLARTDSGPSIPDRVPDIVFEIVSPDRESRERDYVSKRRDYQTLGVREYVIVDRYRRRVTIDSRTGSGYEKRVVRGTGVYQSSLLPGLEVGLLAAFG